MNYMVCIPFLFLPTTLSSQCAVLFGNYIIFNVLSKIGFSTTWVYNSAALVSTNNELRRSIHRHALESKLLGAIGHAEMEKEIQKTVKQVARDKDELEKELEEPVELDEMELEKYIEFVVNEVRKGSRH